MHPALACRQCGSTRLRDLGAIPPGRIFAGQRLEPPWHGGNLYRCGDCALVFRAPLRPAADYRALYASAPADTWTVDPGRNDRSEVCRAVAGHAAGGRVLDVGCFDGSLLAALGPGWEAYGVEPSAAGRAAAQARGVQIVAETLEGLGPDAGPFDAITLVDVIEHLPNPREPVERLLGLLRPGGVLVVSTGSVDAPAWRLAGGRYWYCTIPEHVSFVGREWAERLGAALRVPVRVGQRFAHRQLPAAERRAGQREFARKVRLSSLKLAIARGLPLPPERRRPRHEYGRAGLFDDHVVLCFSRPAA